MNLKHRYQNIEKYLKKYEGIKIYDYSLSNIHILNSNGFTNTHHLPYLIYKEEHDFLVNLKKNTEQIYDFGIISAENPVIVERRLAVVNFLINNGYTVKVIQGFKGLRDKQIAQCRILLNIHGSNNGEVSKIFEHIRCDRLLEAGYHILSEDCLHLDPVFVKKYSNNLKIIDYNEFFKKETYVNLKMKIRYGIINNYIDITDICLQKLNNNNIITIPYGDGNRTNIFSDPIYGTLKKIFILVDGELYEYDDTLTIKINLTDKTISVINNDDINNKINNIHSKLQLKYGSFSEELPEQKMVLRYLKGHEKVLEIGGNIGRNSLIIGHILKSNNNNNFVTLESNVNIAPQLVENRNLNNMNFHIEPSALSKRKLIQQGWNTIVSDVLLDGYQPVNCVTFDELQTKYNIIFDTLVLDCEGAFYYILMDMPEILNNIKLIIMENDYLDIYNKQYIDNILTQNNFAVDYVESGGWGPCYNNFFEVWKKNTNTNNKKIIDCVTFYNEIEMLTYRLNLLYNVVDYFVIVEARQTHVGNSKPLYFEENKERFQQFSDKIIHVVADLPFTKDTINIVKGDQWTNEKHQRNCISKGLEQINIDISNKLDLDDVIIIADLDEIPDPDTLSKIGSGQIQITSGISSLEQDLYYYNLNSRYREKWYHAKILTVKKYKELGVTCDAIRFINGDIIVKGGWHMSYFGNTSFIKNKLENFAHQEYNSEKYTDTNEIQKRIDNHDDLFGRESTNHIERIEIIDNDYLPPLYDIYLKGFYNNPNPNPNPKIEIKNNITIGFHSNQLCERGVSVALYDYAYYNQKIYGNTSIIFYCKHYNSDTNVIRKFEKEFKCYAYDTFSDIDKIILDEKIDYFYNIKSGSKSDNQLVTKCPNLIHAVFTVEPHGEKYATISKQLSSKYNNIVDYVPHMINLPECNENMREQINIPNNAIVLGRIGGFYQFDIQIAHNAIKNILDIDSNIFFLFVNTNIFYEHPQIIYLDKIIDLIEKVKFINTCDAMIHARSDGETFGLAIAEFSSLNKPVITSVSNTDNSHIEILGSKGIIYDTEESLIKIFKNIRTIIKSKNDWNAYKEYTPEKVMKKFMDVFELNIYTKEILFDKLLITCYKNDDLANSSICKNEKWEPHIMEFLNVYKTFFKITSIVDVGANIGYHTLYFSDIVDKNCGIVYAFEPQPQIYKLLVKNINNNDKNNVIIYNLACSDCECESKIAHISLDSQNTNMGDFTLNHNIMSDNFYKVKCVRLDDILKDTIDIIKIDVQGWEQNVLNGSQNIISNYKPLLIIEIEEYQLNRNGMTSEKLITQIRNFGYYIYYLDYKYPSDHICVHETKLQEFNTHFKKYIFEHNELNNINNNILYGINKKIKCFL